MATQLSAPRARGDATQLEKLIARRARGIKRGRRIPRQQRPSHLERAYATQLLTIVDRVREALAPLLEELPRLLERNARGRLDAGEGERLRQLIAEALARVRGFIDPAQLDALAQQLGHNVSSFSGAQLRRQIIAALGVDVFASEAGLAAIVEGFAAENVSLITNLATRLVSDVEGATTRALANATRHTDLAKEIEALMGTSRKRAKLIARDQVGKLNGKVNRQRQTNLGINKYIWRTGKDRRVRGTPGGAFPNAKYSHFEREGEVFSWDKPPPDGHPGEPILCRCSAEPDFGELLAGL
jgi:SPP1 gp7 family putative phage head morphogenesis protein